MSNTVSDTSKESVEDIFHAGREYQRRLDAQAATEVEPALADFMAAYKKLDSISRRALLDEAWRLADEERDLDREARWPRWLRVPRTD